MFAKTAAVLALAASLGGTGLAGSASSSVGTPGWLDTDANAAGSRANLAETALTPAAVTKVKYLRSITSPLAPPGANCPSPIVAPLVAGGSLYAITNSRLSKYDPATGNLIWRSTPNRAFNVFYHSLAISGNLLIVGGSFCGSASEPPNVFYAYNATTGSLVWKATPGEGFSQAVIVGSFVVTAGQDAAGSFVTVLSLSNGNIAWNSSGCMSGGSGAPIVVGQLVISYGCDNQGNATLKADNLATGALVWSLPTGGWTLQRGDLAGSAGTHLYATDPSGTVVDLNPQTGKQQYPLSGAVNVLAVDTSRAYATCGSGGQSVCGYDVSTGALDWQDAPNGDPPGLAAEADGVLYLDDGLALNAATGLVIKRLWAPVCFTACTSDLPTALAVGDGRIAVVSDPRVLDLFGVPGS
jgi:hypothetical protein